MGAYYITKTMKNRWEVCERMPDWMEDDMYLLGIVLQWQDTGGQVTWKLPCIRDKGGSFFFPLEVRGKRIGGCSDLFALLNRPHACEHGDCSNHTSEHQALYTQLLLGGTHSLPVRSSAVQRQCVAKSSKCGTFPLVRCMESVFPEKCLSFTDVKRTRTFRVSSCVPPTQSDAFLIALVRVPSHVL